MTFARARVSKFEGTYPSRLVLDVSGSAMVLQKVFHVHIYLYPGPMGAFFLHPMLIPPWDLEVPLLHVSGLDNYHRPFIEIKKRNIPIENGDLDQRAGSCQGMDFRDVYPQMFPPTLMGQVRRWH